MPWPVKAVTSLWARLMLRESVGNQEKCFYSSVTTGQWYGSSFRLRLWETTCSGCR